MQASKQPDEVAMNTLILQMKKQVVIFSKLYQVPELWHNRARIQILSIKTLSLHL